MPFYVIKGDNYVRKKTDWNKEKNVKIIMGLILKKNFNIGFMLQVQVRDLSIWIINMNH